MKLFTYLKGDRVIWTIVFLLSLLSILVVYSSVVTLAHKYKQGNTEWYLVKHAIMIFGGIIIMYVIHKLKYTFFSRVAQIGIILGARSRHRRAVHWCAGSPLRHCPG